jgi:hypothetical protein
MASTTLRSEVGNEPVMRLANVDHCPLEWWEDSPAAVAKREILLQKRTPLRTGLQRTQKTQAGLTLWHRMLGRTYCLI